MTLTHRSHLVAALLGTAFLSCAGSGARKDNQAPPAPEHRIVYVGPGQPSAGPVAVAPQWRRHMNPQDAQGPQHLYFQTAPHGGDMLVPGGPTLGVKVDPSSDGLRVSEVLETSIAQSAGVKVDDVLLRIGDERVNRVADVRRALHGKKPGDQVKVAVIRAGEGIVELTGTVPEPPADSADATDGTKDATAVDGQRGGFLGVQLKEADDAAAAAEPKKDGAVSEPGVVIDGVVPNSAAWFAGLDAQDRLLSIDGQAVANRADVVGAVASKEPGVLVELKYVRAGEEHTAKVRLGHRGPMNMLGSLQDLGGLRFPRLPNQRVPGTAMGQQFQMFAPFDQDDFAGLFDGLPLPLDASTQSVQVEIDGDRMTIERDGETEHYRRGADGEWQPADGATIDTSADQSRA